jgi:hypothetical protein
MARNYTREAIGLAYEKNSFKTVHKKGGLSWVRILGNYRIRRVVAWDIRRLGSTACNLPLDHVEYMDSTAMPKLDLLEQQWSYLYFAVTFLNYVPRCVRGGLEVRLVSSGLKWWMATKMYR